MSRSTSHVEALREEFDASFARAPDASIESTVDLLLVRAGSSIVAIETSALAATELGRAIVPTPDAPAGMLGISGLRGALIAVYDFAHVLGERTPPETRGVLLIPKVHTTMALRVSAIEGHVQVPTSRMLPVSSAAPQSFVTSYGETDAGSHPVYDVSAVVAHLLEGA